MNVKWKNEFKRTELTIDEVPYEIFEKIDSIGNRHYSMRGPLGKDMNNGELLLKLLEMKQKKIQGKK
jgi:hypothetical protein